MLFAALLLQDSKTNQGSGLQSLWQASQTEIAPRVKWGLLN